MATKRYRVKLTAEEREELKALTTKGRVSARKQTHGRILLQCDECREDGGRTDSAIAPALCGGGTGGGAEPEGAVEPAGEGSGWGGGSSAGGDRLWRWRSPGGICAVVAALARGSLGGVRDRGWRESGDGSSYAKKNDLKPWLKQCWCIPPKSDAQFAYAMEDIPGGVSSGIPGR